jgi:hypothetical protein
MTKPTLFLPGLCLMMLTACGPSTDIPATNGSAIASAGGTTSTTTSTGSGSGSLGGIIPLGTSSTGANANNVTTPSTATGTVAITGAINSNTFTAQDAVFGVSQTTGGLVVLTVVIADQPNLCSFLAAQSGAANLVIAYLSSTNPNTYPVANTYPVTDPNGNIPDAVTNDSAFSMVAFAAVGATSGTFANNGQIQITTSATMTTDPESMSIQVTDAAGDSVQGTLTPAYCNVLGDKSNLLKLPRLQGGLH